MTRVTDDFKGDLKGYLNKRRNEKSEGSKDGWYLIYDQAS